MTKLLLDEKKDTHNIVVIFANTGCEHEATLEFVRDCDLYWGFNTVWIEAVVGQNFGEGIRHKIVNFDSAARNGEPFEDVIKKYGIPNIRRPLCSTKLKVEAINSYLKSIGFIKGKKINHETAIGIRMDEMDRISVNKEKNKFIYPLIEKNWNKEMVINYMKSLPWDLKVPEWQGNCVWCWKKSVRTLATIAKDNPDAFDFPKKMEQKYGRDKKVEKYIKREDGLVSFFRKDSTVEDILELSRSPTFQRRKPEQYGFNFKFDDFLDKAGSCSESCEGYDTDGK